MHGPGMAARRVSKYDLQAPASRQALWNTRNTVHLPELSTTAQLPVRWPPLHGHCCSVQRAAPHCPPPPPASQPLQQRGTTHTHTHTPPGHPCFRPRLPQVPEPGWDYPSPQSQSQAPYTPPALGFAPPSRSSRRCDAALGPLHSACANGHIACVPLCRSVRPAGPCAYRRATLGGCLRTPLGCPAHACPAPPALRAVI